MAGRNTATYRLHRNFYLCQHSNFLQGYIFGGVIAGPLGWRAAFLLEAAAMVPFVVFCALAPPINLKGMETGASLRSVVLPSPLYPTLWYKRRNGQRVQGCAKLHPHLVLPPTWHEFVFQV